MFWLPESYRLREQSFSLSKWKPRLHQALIIDPARNLSFHEEHGIMMSHFCGHRRCGKTDGGVFGFNKLSSDILQEDSIFKMRGDVDSHNPRLVFMAETKEQARNIVWKQMTQTLTRFSGAKANKTRMTITIPRPSTQDELEIMVLAYRDHERTRGIKARYIHADEIQMATETAIKKSIMSTLQDSNGSLLTTGTATSIGHYPQLIKESMEVGISTAIVPVTMTGVFTRKEIEEMRLKYGELAFRQEYLCDFTVSTATTFFEKELDRLEKNPMFYTAAKIPGRPRILGVDIGVKEGFAAWLVEVDPHGMFIDVIDYFHGYEVLDTLRKDLEDNHYIPDCIILPHDRTAKKMGARAPETNQSVYREVFPECHYIGVAKPGNKYMPISQTQLNLHMLRFPPEDAMTDAHMGLHWLKRFRRKEDKWGSASEVIDKTDAASHCADALIHIFQGLRVKNGVARMVPRYRLQDRDTAISIRTDISRNHLFSDEGVSMFDFS